MNFIDLCAGIGGIRLGLEQAGHKCVGFCEFDKFAIQSYKAIHNTEGEWEAHDITGVTDDDIKKLAKERTIDIICGGFPCQAFSVAGKRKGFADTRGTIFFEICRFIRIIKPKYFICENVKGLLSHEGGQTFGIILETLAELGYCVEWQILNSKNFGVPQNRERVFLVGHFGAGGRGKVFPIFGANGENPCKLQEMTSKVAQAHRVYNPENGLSVTLSSLGGGLGAKTGLYAVQKAFTVDKPVGTKGGTGALKIKNVGTEIAATLAARYYKGLSVNGCNGVICIQKTHGNTTTVKVEETGTLQAARLDKVPNILTRAVLTPDREKKRQNGRRMKEPGEPMFTLTAQDRHGVAIVQRPRGKNNGGLHEIAPTVTSNSYHENNLLKNNIRIRKLTPRECWRLQGFPDEYFNRAKVAGVSDSQLYKQAGNAVTVNVAAAIGHKLREIQGE